MKISTLQLERYEEIKQLFLDVFSNEPWFDKWEDDKQINQYLHELIDNKNSLSLVFIDENDKIVGGSLGYVFSWWKQREYYIKEFFILREKQNQGVGSAFLNMINDYLTNKEIKAIWLSTEKTLPAYNFYIKNGFIDLSNTVFLAKTLD